MIVEMFELLFFMLFHASYPNVALGSIDPLPVCVCCAAAIRSLSKNLSVPVLPATTLDRKKFFLY